MTYEVVDVPPPRNKRLKEILEVEAEDQEAARNIIAAETGKPYSILRAAPMVGA